jgi:hypothetical protein
MSDPMCASQPALLNVLELKGYQQHENVAFLHFFRLESGTIHRSPTCVATYTTA